MPITAQFQSEDCEYNHVQLRETRMSGRVMSEGGPSKCVPVWGKNFPPLFERLASLGIMAAQLKAPLKPLYTIVLWCFVWFQVVSSIGHTWLPRDVSLSDSFSSFLFQVFHWDSFCPKNDKFKRVIAIPANFHILSLGISTRVIFILKKISWIDCNY